MNREISANNRESSLKGLRIRTLSLWMVIGTILVAILIGAGITNVMDHYYELSHMTSEYILVQDDVMNMSLGSDYLTEQARLYAVTKERSYADAYFTEADITQRRDKALQEMSSRLNGADKASLGLLTDALELSNELMDLEIHSMKLAALSIGEDISGFSPKIRDYPLTEEELQYTSREKSEAAYQLVFGQKYREQKREIEEKLSNVTASVISACSLRQAKSEEAMKHALLRQSFYTVLIVLLVILAYVMIAVLILRPIRIYINCIKNNNILEITGSYEFKYLAITYNNVYEMAVEQQNILRRKAENDALTGLLNRQAFEQLKIQLHETAQPLALLLIDVDVFKSINDTYGHEAGDRALIKVAGLLSENFRSDDYISRIGGDEFSVIMKRMQADTEEIIREKIAKINRILQNPGEGFPKYSVSVGVAFSEKGYHEELFCQADQALYHTKENGRCGCTFYGAGQFK